MRLLYVGMTRGRDHLVMVRTAAPAAWLAKLDAGVDGHVVLPMLEDRSAKAGATKHPARFQLVAAGGAPAAVPAAALYLATGRPAASHRPLRLRPSGAGPDSSIGALSRVDLGRRLPIVGAPEMDALGQAVRASSGRTGPSATGPRGWPGRACRSTAGTSPATSAPSSWWRPPTGSGRSSPAATRARASAGRCGVRAVRDAGRLVVGRVDLLVEMADSFAVVDHKSFPGREDLWDAKAVVVSPQLDAYARAIALATGGTSDGLLVHMPLVGTVIEVGALASTEAVVAG